MSFISKLLGRRLTLKAKKREALSIWTGVPAVGLDALASTAYGPEAALMILLPLGLIGLHYFFYIMLVIIAILISLYLSYMQTIAAYPKGGGAYIVASDNLGQYAGLCAAVALLIDYLLNVAVGISAGVGAMVSALPVLYPYITEICLLVLLMLTVLNLRGVRESGLAFVVPTGIFVLFMGMTMILGSIHSLVQAHPHPIKAPPALPIPSAQISLWLFLSALANGLTAMTGIEAVSNAVPLFKKPGVKNARWSLTIIMTILGLFLFALSYLCPEYQIVAQDETKQGYQTILSQLVAAVMGKGVFYYFSIVSMFIILTYSAQTSFVDFPRVCRLLAEDNFMPHIFAERGRRLVFSYGILILAILSALLLIVFKGITFALIPLFAIGAFSAFLFSQIGMIFYWHRHAKKFSRGKLFFNILGVIANTLALTVIIIAKFMAGAWVIILLAPILVVLLIQIKRHYKKISTSAHQVEKYLGPL